MFTIERKSEQGLEVIYLVNNDNHHSIGVLPDHGALLHAFTVQLGNQAFNCIDNYSDGNDLQQQFSTSYKSAKLSPFVCRTNRGKYMLDGKEYEFANKFQDGTAIHGLLYNQPFTVADSFVTEQEAVLTLVTEYKGTDPGFPFHFSCKVRYSFSCLDELKVETIIKNTGEASMPLADGWHPYFKMGNKVDELHLQFCSGKMLEFSEELIPTGNYVDKPDFVEAGPLGKIHLDNCFLLDYNEKEIPACILYNPANGLELKIYADENYPYLQIYTPDTRESIAIENLSGAPDCFNNRMGLLMLKGGEEVKFTVRYRLGVREEKNFQNS